MPTSPARVDSPQLSLGTATILMSTDDDFTEVITPRVIIWYRGVVAECTHGGVTAIECGRPTRDVLLGTGKRPTDWIIRNDSIASAMNVQNMYRRCS